MQNGYFSENDISSLESKMLWEAYQRNQFMVKVCNGYWWMVECGNDSIYNLAQKKMKKHFPELKYLN